ncbi:MAG: CRISPR-associated endonuclease Cas2 [Bryobacteraceae bacterium]
MWLFALFDLPVETKDHRREYTQFRKALLREGFVMLQYSVYARHGVSEEAVETVRGHVRQALPPHGQVRLLAVTDHQFGRMEVFFGKKRSRSEDPPAQLMLF